MVKRRLWKPREGGVEPQRSGSTIDAVCVYSHCSTIQQKYVGYSVQYGVLHCQKRFHSIDFPGIFQAQHRQSHDYLPNWVAIRVRIIHMLIMLLDPPKLVHNAFCLPPFCGIILLPKPYNDDPALPRPVATLGTSKYGASTRSTPLAISP